MINQQKKLPKATQENQDEIILEENGDFEKINPEYFNATKLFVGKKISNLPTYLLAKCKNLNSVMIEKRNKYYYFEDGYIFNKQGKAVMCIGTPCIPDSVTEISFDVFLSRGTTEVDTFYIGKSLKNITSAHRDFNIKNIILSEDNTAFIIEDGCLYQKDSNEIILGCENSIIGKRTTSIGHSAFRSCTMQHITILSENLKMIDKCAFKDCKNLKEITLPQCVTSIGYAAFDGCTNLKTLALPQNLTLLEEHVFYCSGLENIEISNKITEIGSYAFGYCKQLKTVVLGDCLNKISKGAFYNCFALNEIIIPDSVLEIESHAFDSCKKLKNVKLPQTLKVISQNCFSDCKSLENITLPQSITFIDYGAFYNCSCLVSINLKNVTKIEDEAFKNCKNLENIESFENFKSFGKKVFHNCNKLCNVAAMLNPEPPLKDLYSLYTIDEIINEFKFGDMLEFTTYTLDEVLVRFQNLCDYQGKKYLFVIKKANKILYEYFIEITAEIIDDEERFPKDFNPYYICNVYDNKSQIFTELKSSLK